MISAKNLHESGISSSPWGAVIVSLCLVVIKCRHRRGEQENRQFFFAKNYFSLLQMGFNHYLSDSLYSTLSDTYVSHVLNLAVLDCDPLDGTMPHLWTWWLFDIGSMPHLRTSWFFNIFSKCYCGLENVRMSGKFNVWKIYEVAFSA